MRVSVAIACFNQGHFLADAIGSALTQTRVVDELIVVDDGSTDDTAQVAARYPEVHYVYKCNGGLASARNEALRRASGDRILFLDADDILLPNAIADCLAAFEVAPDVAFVYGGYREVTASRDPLWEKPAEQHSDPFERLLTGNYISMHGTVMYQTALLRDSGGFNENLSCCEDYDVYLRLSRGHRIRAYRSIAAEYRRHENAMTRDRVRMLRYARAVLHCHAKKEPLSRSAHRAYREGLEFMTGYYAEAAMDQARDLARNGQIGRAATVLLGGLRWDPAFTRRVLSRFWRAARSRLSRARIASAPRRQG